MVGRGVYGASHELSFVAGSNPALLANRQMNGQGFAVNDQ